MLSSFVLYKGCIEKTMSQILELILELRATWSRLAFFGYFFLMYPIDDQLEENLKLLNAVVK